jgi:hypothetical protein
MTKVTVTVLIGLLSATAQAQSVNHEFLVNQIEEAIGKPDPVAAASSLVTSMLTMAKNANPEVDPSTWDHVREDTAATLTKLSSGPGSAFDLRVRGALAQFTDHELPLLLGKLNDPQLLKFRDALRQQPNASKSSIVSNALQMTSQINGILAKHNLHQVSFGPTEQLK